MFSIPRHAWRRQHRDVNTAPRFASRSYDSRHRLRAATQLGARALKCIPRSGTQASARRCRARAVLRARTAASTIADATAHPGSEYSDAYRIVLAQIGAPGQHRGELTTADDASCSADMVKRRSKAGGKQAGGAVGIVSATYHFHPTSSSLGPDLRRASRADDSFHCTGSELHHALFSSAYPGVHYFSDSHFDFGLLWRGVSRHSQDCERTGTSCRPWAGLAPRGWPSAHCARARTVAPSLSFRRGSLHLLYSDVDPTFGTCYRTPDNSLP